MSKAQTKQALGFIARGRKISTYTNRVRKNFSSSSQGAQAVVDQSRKKIFKMKFSLPMPGGGTGMTLFSKLIRTKDLRKLQGDDPKSTKPKLTVNLIFSELPLEKDEKLKKK